MSSLGVGSILGPYIEAEYRVRDRNGVLELALLLAVDRLREHEGGEEQEVLDGLLEAAEERLIDADRLPRPFLSRRGFVVRDAL